MRMMFTLEFECTEAEPDELVQALLEHCAVIDMPNGDTLFLEDRDVQHVEAPSGDEMPLERAKNLAELWRAGKLIGGDPHAACIALLAELERLNVRANRPSGAAQE